MRMTPKQAAAIVQQIADEHAITDAFDLFDAAYIEHLVYRVNQRPMPAGYSREDIFAMWVSDDLGVLDHWDSNQRQQQEMDAR